MKLVAKVAAIRLTATILLRNADNNGASHVVAADRRSFPRSLTSKISSGTPSRFCNDRTPPPSLPITVGVMKAYRPQIPWFPVTPADCVGKFVYVRDLPYEVSNKSIVSVFSTYEIIPSLFVLPFSLFHGPVMRAVSIPTASWNRNSSHYMDRCRHIKAPRPLQFGTEEESASSHQVYATPFGMGQHRLDVS
ncbi:hypothetical protein P5673_018158 [Acropora cervicornis]|uniref:Uncharacterized protein n=1 Tax=Acropora cervicornis TaxID=6130 RepID=A0AAD9QDR1_ACRCE|nr:hypothetical protein P5673_018158 [Acropora cervicornis]